MLREYDALWRLGYGYIDPPIGSSEWIYGAVDSRNGNSEKTVS
jgi:hypothetical protein